MEKLMIVDIKRGKGNPGVEAEIVTVNSRSDNRYNRENLDSISIDVLADNIVRIAIREGYDRVLIDSRGVGIALVDHVINNFNQVGYFYHYKSGKVLDK